MPTGRRHYRVTFADAVEAHDLAIDQGGRRGLLSEASVLSALGRPYSGYHRAIAAKASALVEAIIRNHGFVDGNKRTATLLLFLLLARSGFSLRAVEPHENLDEALETTIVSIAAGRMDRETLEAWLKPRIVARAAP